MSFALDTHRARLVGNQIEGRRHQGFCVRRLGVVEDLVRRTLLDDFSIPHDDDLVGHRPDHLQVMADKQIGEVVPHLEIAQQVDDLCLDGAVQRRRRLIKDDEARLQHHGAGDRDTLALAAREFVRIAVLHIGLEADFPQRVADDLTAFLERAAEAVNQQTLFDDLPDGRRAANRGDAWVFAVEFADVPRAYTILAYGQSPDPESPHFDDQAGLFARGEMKPIRWTRADVDAAAVRRYTPGAGR